jgi:hypothetical protein
MYNAGFFTENKLPRGMLLLNAPADMNEIEDIEDYISNLMSGPPTSQWRIPIVPTGKSPSSSDSGGKVFEWVNLQGSNKDMEFQSWYDLQMSGVASMFGRSLEELGLHSSKSQPLIGTNTEPKIEASKSLGLGDLLTFLQKHFNQILQYKNPDYCFEFAGYEKDDLKLVSDIDSTEIGSWKTLNEKRLEKGMEPIDLTKIENPADLPMSPQTVQLWQGMKMGGGMGAGFDDTDFATDEDMEGDDGEEAQDDGAESGVNNDEWEALVSQHVQKSIAGSKHDVIRIVI